MQNAFEFAAKAYKRSRNDNRLCVLLEALNSFILTHLQSLGVSTSLTTTSTPPSIMQQPLASAPHHLPVESSSANSHQHRSSSAVSSLLPVQQQHHHQQKQQYDGGGETNSSAAPFPPVPSLRMPSSVAVPAQGPYVASGGNAIAGGVLGSTATAEGQPDETGFDPWSPYSIDDIWWNWEELNQLLTEPLGIAGE